jgi:hypothetical protein
VTIEAINEHIKLNKELEKHALSTDDIHKLVTVLINAKKYGIGGKEIADKLYNFKFLEWKDKELKDKRKKLSKRISKFTHPFIHREDCSFWYWAANYYKLPYVSAAMRLIEDIKICNKINGLKHELDRLSLQKYTLDQACSNQCQSLIALSKLKSYGLTEDRLLQLNNFLENNGYKDTRPNSDV